MIQEKILELTEYGLVTGLVAPEDKRFTINRLLELFQLDELEDEVAAAYEKREPMTQETAEDALEGILNHIIYIFNKCSKNRVCNIRYNKSYHHFFSGTKSPARRIW